MKKVTKTMYKCEECSAEYTDIKEAKRCEARHWHKTSVEQSCAKGGHKPVTFYLTYLDNYSYSQEAILIGKCQCGLRKREFNSFQCSRARGVGAVSLAWVA